MRSLSVLAALSIVCGCSDAQTGPTGNTPGTAGGAEVAQSQQKAQFTNFTLLNLVDPLTASLALTADTEETTVRLYYIGDKLSSSGQHTESAPVLIDTITLAPDQTRIHNVNLFNSAFSGGYGSVFLDSDFPLNLFQTYVQYGGAMFSVGGSVFEGGSYRVPYFGGTLRMVLAITNQSDFTYPVTISKVNGTNVKIVELPPLSTFRFDSVNEGWSLGGTGSVQLTTTAGGTVAVSGYIDRFLQRTRITPVKAAPYL